MKTLSIWQPWASLIVHGIKKIETRSWHHRGLLGPLLIHASKTWTSEQESLCCDDPFRAALREMDITQGEEENLPFGCIIGQVSVVAYQTTDDLAEEMSTFGKSRELALGNYAPGRWGWILENPIRFTPIPFRGRQNVFDVPDDLFNTGAS